MKEGATLDGVALSLFGERGRAVSLFAKRAKIDFSELEESLARYSPASQTPPDVIELYQFPWSPYCLVQRRILEFSRAPHKIINLSTADRSVAWKLTKERYYQLPILREGRNVLFETGDNSQVLGKYLDDRLKLGLFPRELAGVQDILWAYIDNDVESYTFKLNDAYFTEFVPCAEQLAYRRHKERKFGRHCLEQWRAQEKTLRAELSERLVPFESMLAQREFLLDAQPRFVDFDLWGILANLKYSGHHDIPAAHARLRGWHDRMSKIKFTAPAGARRK